MYVGEKVGESSRTPGIEEPWLTTTHEKLPDRCGHLGDDFPLCERYARQQKYLGTTKLHVTSLSRKLLIPESKIFDGNKTCLQS